jgi:hypothetical protein
VKKRVLNMLISLDQFLFCWVCLGGVNPDSTASAVAWSMEQEGRWQGKLFRPLIDALFFFHKDHCKQAYEAEKYGPTT